MWVYQKENCVLCAAASKDISHLCFKCAYSKAIWEEAMRRNGIGRNATSWVEETVNVLRETTWDSFKAKVRKLTFAGDVYHV